MAQKNNLKEKVDPFTPGQKVWLIDNKPTEVDQIRGSITPEVVTFDTYESLFVNISSRYVNTEAYGTLIISKNIPNDIRQHWNTFINAMNNEQIVNRSFIFQITNEGTSPFVKAKVYGNVQDFLDDANNIHLNRVIGNTDISEQAQQMLRQLKASKNNYQARYEQMVKDNHDLNEKLSQVESHSKQLQSKIAYYEQRSNQAEELSNQAKQDIKDNHQKIVNLTTGLDQARAQENADKDTIIALKAKIEGQSRQIKEISAKNNSLDQQIRDLQSELDEVNETNRNLLRAKTDAERVGEMQNQVNAAQDKIANLKHTINKLQQDQVFNKSEITRLQESNQEIRNGYRDYSQVGYSNVFQDIKLTKTNVLYFKIIEDLPYHRFYINRIAEIMKNLLPKNIHIVTVMMKVDQGNDRKRFADKTFIGDLGGINEAHDQYYLIPSKRMGEDVDDLEQQNVIILFLDYIDNSKYYLETKGLMDYYYICKSSRIGVQIYDLKGLPISYDHHSIFDIKYNQRLSTMTSQNQQEYFDNNVANLIADSKVVTASIQD